MKITKSSDTFGAFLFVNFNIELSDNPQSLNKEVISKIRLEIKALSEILSEEKMNNDAPG